MAGVLDRYYNERMKDPQFRVSLLIDRFIADLHIEMKLKNINQKQLAEKLGITEVAVSKFLNFDTNKNPKLETLMKYAEALEIPVILRAGKPENKKQFDLWKGEVHFPKRIFKDVVREKSKEISIKQDKNSSSNNDDQMAA